MADLAKPARKVSSTVLIDKLFNDLTNSEQPNLEYYQAKLDLILEKFGDRVGGNLYKLYICQGVICFIKEDYSATIEMLEKSDEVRQGGEIGRQYEKIKNAILARSYSVLKQAELILAYHRRRLESWVSRPQGCFLEV